MYRIHQDAYHIIVPEGRDSLERSEILAIVNEIKTEVDKYVVEGISDTEHMLITAAAFLNYYEISLSTLDEIAQTMIFEATEKFNIPLKDSVLQ